MKRLRTAIVLITALALSIVACGGAPQAPAVQAPSTTQSPAQQAAPVAQTPAKVRIVLQWVAQAQFAGYFAARDKGYYKDEGLDVEIKPGGPDIIPAQVVGAGQAEFGIAPFITVLQAREGGADAVAIANIIQRVSQVLVSFKDKGITGVPDMKGKRVGSWLGGNEAEQFALLRKYNLDPQKDVQIIKQGFDMSQLLNGDIDVAQALIYNEYAQLLETTNPKTGKLYIPDDFNLVSLDKEGIQAMQDTVFTTQKWLSQSGNADVATRFLKASFKGWIYCRDNRDDCVSMVLKAGSALGQSHQTWQMNEVNGLIWPAPNGVGVPNNSDLVTQTVNLALTYKLLKQQPDSQAWRWDLAQQADNALKTAGVDVVGANFQKGTVTLQPGGK